jgi:hypothetical protein
MAMPEITAVACTADEEQAWLQQQQKTWDRAISAEQASAEQMQQLGGAVLQRVRGEPGFCVVDPNDYRIVFSRESFDAAMVTSEAHVVCSGLWFYEITIIDLGSPGTSCQFGWADSNFGRVKANSDVGVGDNESSWAIDGPRKKKWHNAADVDFGKAWAVGDVVGCAADLFSVPNRLLFGLNGQWEKPLGTAFRGVSFDKALAPALTSNGATVVVN